MIAALLLAGCDWLDDGPRIREKTEVYEQTGRYAASGTDVVLIVLDTLRADHLSQYGYDLDTSPGLAKLAAVSTRFDSAWAPSPWTLPSTVAIHTGLHPLRLGTRHPGDVLPDSALTLAERFRAAGWHTAGWSYNIVVSPRHGFAQGFDVFTHAVGHVVAYPNAGRMTRAAALWSQKNQQGPRLLYLHPMNCHGPYRVPESRESTLLGHAPDPRFRYYKGSMAKILRDGDLGERERVSEGYLASLQEQYDTSLRFETDMVGEFLDALDDQGRLDAALVVLTADHGEELFDHGGFSHAYTLHSELLRVPLFVKLPGQTEARVVGDPVQLVDLAPTIMEVAGLPAKDEGLPMDGRSLVPLLRGETLAPARIVHDVSWPRRIVGRGLVDGDWKYVEIDQNYEGLKDAARLWNLRDDPRENHDLLAAEPERAASMKAALASAVAALSSDAKPENVMTEEERRQLEALGYLE